MCCLGTELIVSTTLKVVVIYLRTYGSSVVAMLSQSSARRTGEQESNGVHREGFAQRLNEMQKADMMVKKDQM